MKPVKIIQLNTVDSTNNYLKELAKNGACENTVVIAQSQTAGKGTKNRSFVSEKGGVYLSVLLRPDTMGFDGTLITSMTAVAVSDAIDQISGKKTQIKWVNDIYLEGKKVCGILCESVLSPDGKMPFVIVGIGVNLFKPQQDFPPEIKDIATYVFEQENTKIKEDFITILLSKFYEYFEEINNKTFLSKYREKNLVLGREISVIKGEKIYPAKALEIDDNCRLLVEFPDKTQKFLSSGEVKVKL